MMCDRCFLEFEDDPKDLRPFLYHRCPDMGDDVLFGNPVRNPRFFSKRRGEPRIGEQRSNPVQYTYGRKVYDK